MFGAKAPLALAISLIAAAPTLGQDSLPGPIPAAVERVVDGDTIAVRARIWVDTEVAVLLRLADIQAPETRRPSCGAERAAGEAARDALAARIGEGVALADVRNGVYAGRVIARVLDAEGGDIGAHLLADGHVVAYGAAEPWCIS